MTGALCGLLLQRRLLGEIKEFAPYQTPRFDPYAGTVFQGVAPY